MSRAVRTVLCLAISSVICLPARLKEHDTSSRLLKLGFSLLLLREEKFDHVVFPIYERCLEHFSQLDCIHRRHSFDNFVVHTRTLDVGVLLSTSLHQKERKEWYYQAFKSVYQIRISLE